MALASPRSTALALMALALWPLTAFAQVRPPRVDLRPLVEADGVPPGGTVEVALTVTLPAGFHVQSNAPRDPLLIPTELAIDAPAGFTVRQIGFPPARDLVQAGQREPLAVFDQVFTVRARLTVAKDRSPQTVTVPAHLRYQACNAQLCFPPVTATIEWKVRVVALRSPRAAMR